VNKSFQFYLVLALGLHGIALFGLTFAPPKKVIAKPPVPEHVEVTLVEPAPVEEPRPPEPEPLPPEPIPEPEPTPAPQVQETPPPEPAPVPPQPAPVLQVAEPTVAPANAEFVVAATTNKVIVPEIEEPESTPQPVVVPAPIVVKTEARYRRNPEPPYPLQAKRRRQEGLVLLRVLVTPQGTAKQLEVMQSSGFTILDEAAVQAVRAWEFEPAVVDGRLVSSEVEVPVRFKLVK
jgi:protein TonB